MASQNNSRLGPRCGSKIRKNISTINTSKQELATCPKCQKKKMKRTCVGVWECRICEHQASGGAYKLNV